MHHFAYNNGMQNTDVIKLTMSALDDGSCDYRLSPHCGRVVQIHIIQGMQIHQRIIVTTPSECRLNFGG